MAVYVNLFTKALRRGRWQMRPGFGTRHPLVTAALDAQAPAATVEAAWAGGAIPLRVSAYTAPAPLPDELVLSVRCLVRVGAGIVVCHTIDGHTHVMPGGRRRPGESHEDTACREVHEETGWLLDPASVRLLGWLHFFHLRPQPSDHPSPHPDFLQVVYTADARRFTGCGPWIDSEGYEIGSAVEPLSSAPATLSSDPVQTVFLAVLDTAAVAAPRT